MADPITWFADKFLELSREDEKFAREHADRVAGYLDELAECLSAMAEGLRNRQVPREAAHHYRELAKTFGDINPLGEHESSKTFVARLRQAASVVQTLSSSDQLSDRKRAKHIATIERLCGNLRGKAGVIRASVRPRQKPVIKYAAVLSVVGAIAVLTAITAWWSNGWGNHNKSSEIELGISVIRNEQAFTLISGLPFRQNDLLKLKAKVPGHLNYSLLWFGSEGNLLMEPVSVAEPDDNGVASFVWPSESKFQKVGGAPGIEFIFVSGWKGSPPNRERLEALFRDVTPFPPFPVDAALWVNNRQVDLKTSRAPVDVTNAPEKDFFQSGEQLRSSLLTHCDHFAGWIVTYQK
jgi:hypothetical protein